MRVLPIGEARRRLPELVRKVAGGHAPIPIGRRGRCEAILAAAAIVPDAIVRRPLEGLAEIVGSWKDVARAQEEMRLELEASLERTARLISGRVPKRAATRRPARR